MSRFADVGEKKKRKSGIPSSNAGEYLVMGELLRRGFDAQLADRNTKGYDLLTGSHGGDLKRVQVKTVWAQPWYVNRLSFQGAGLNQITVYVLLGPEDTQKRARFFIVRNCDVVDQLHQPPGWESTAFLKLKAIEKYENEWEMLR
jgi:hypothetical protein